MSQARARRLEVSPAALGSLGLHIVVGAILMISWGARDLKVGSVVPVTIVSNAPPAEARAAEQADETQAALTEEPALEAPPEPVQPPPPPPTAARTPPPKPTQKAPAPTPSPKAAKPAEKSFDLDALAASLTKPARNAPQRPSNAQQGPTRQATAPTGSQTAGASDATVSAALEGLADDLQKRWNPNCSIDGRTIIVKVTFQIGIGGQVVGNVDSQWQGRPIDRSGDRDCRLSKDKECLVQAAADRAVSAVHAAAPFRGLPRQLYGQRVTVNFNAREACG